MYKCTMRNIRYKFICFYMETEYEELAIEAHQYSKRPQTSKEFNGGQRLPFFCKHCNDNFNNNNTVSWHRFRGVCSLYREPKLLKIYPIWERNRRIQNKFNITDMPLPVSLQDKRPLLQKHSGWAKKPKLFVGEGQLSQQPSRPKMKHTTKGHEHPSQSPLK